MARHAGFAAAATITGKTINDVALSVVRDRVGPMFFPMPQTIGVGPLQVSFAGIVRMLAPTIELHANPGNLVRVHVGFESTFRAQVTGQPVQTWSARFTGAVDLGLITSIVTNQVVLGVDTAQVTLQPLAVTVLQGPALPPPILAALQSPALAAAATAFVRTLPPLTISPPMLRTQITHTQPADFKDSGFSVFNWFTINLSANRIAVRVLEGAISIGVDFAGFTSGDPTALVDLTRVAGRGAMYVQTLTPQSNPSDTPILEPRTKPAGGSIAIAINNEFLAAVVARQISPQIAGTPISKDVRLERIDLSYARFEKPLRGNEDGLRLGFRVSARGVGVDGCFYIQPYVRTFDGPTSFIGADSWHLFVAKAEVDLPWWVNVGVVVLSLFFSAAMPALSPIFMVGAIALIDGVIPGLQGNVENQAARGLSSSANALGFPTPWNGPLPGLSKPRWMGHIRCISFTSESLDMAVFTAIDWSERAEPPVGVISPTTAYAVQRAPIPLRLKLRDDHERLGPNLTLTWQVLRSDTSQVVATAIKSYWDPAGNGPDLPHSSRDLYTAGQFIVRCTVSASLGNQTGDLWTGQQTLTIEDTLDRRRKFIQWGPDWVHFENAGTNHEWWSHLRTSRIHRTAIGARCRAVRGLWNDQAIRYLDALPFAWSALNDHRGPLCEYCFFGGPDKRGPLPEQDWF